MKNKVSLIFGIMPIGSFILIVWSWELFYKTFVPGFVPPGIGILTGIITTVLLRKLIKQYYPTHGLPTQFIYNTLTWGGYIVFLFFWVNARFTDKAERRVTEKIVSSGYFRGWKGSGPQPYIIVNHDEKEKRIVFYDDRAVYFKQADLTIVKGFFGYEVIKKARLF
jgi:hypothetical protein